MIEHRSKSFSIRPRAMWHWLTEPGTTIQDVVLRRKMRLLAMMLMTLIIGFVLFGITNSVILSHSRRPPLPALGWYAIAVFAYVLNRTNHYRLAARIISGSITVVTAALVITQAYETPVLTLMFLLVGIVLSSLLLSIRDTIVLAIVNILTILLLFHSTVPGLLNSEHITIPFAVNAIISILIIIVMHHRDQVEQDRQAELRRSEDSLRKAHNELEVRVEERTRELQESEALFRNLSEHSPNMIFINCRGRIVYVNDQCERTMGYRSEEFYAPDFDFLTLVAPGSEEIVRQNFRRHMTGEDIPPYDLRVVTKPGEVIDVMMFTKLITYRGQGAILGILANITERVRSEKQTQASLAEKEALLKEIHHRVKNNLQVIASMLNMQRRYTEDKRIIAQLVDSRNRVYSMALVHENLYRSENLARVDLAAYITDLVGNLSQSYNIDPRKAQLKLDVEPVLLTIDQAIPCGLIINELVSNALKHACPKIISEDGMGPCKVEIAIHTYEEEAVSLSVSDNGAGLPPDLDTESGKTLGLRLVRSLARQLESTLEIDRTPQTTFRIRFRIMDEATAPATTEE